MPVRGTREKSSGLDDSDSFDGVDLSKLSEAEIDALQAAQRMKLEMASTKAFRTVERRARDVLTASIRGEPARDHEQRGKLYKERNERIGRHDREMIARLSGKAMVSFEGIVDAEDFLHLDYFVKGIAAARSVGRINRLNGPYFGTGFICAPGMLMTNNHVIPSVEMARFCDVGFETFDNEIALDRCNLNPNRFFYTSPKDMLDVTIVAMEEPLGTELSSALGWHGILSEQGKISLGKPTAIIQYPKNRGKRLVVHNSVMVEITDLDDAKAGSVQERCLWYTSDTAKGSSGSPVFNRNFEVVALHHAGVPKKNANGEYLDAEDNPLPQSILTTDPEMAVYIANQGIRASKIAAGLSEQIFDSADVTSRRDEILRIWQSIDGQEAVRQEMRQRVLLAPRRQFGAGSSGEFFESAAIPHGSTQPNCSGTLFEEIVTRIQRGTMRIEFL